MKGSLLNSDEVRPDSHSRLESFQIALTGMSWKAAQEERMKLWIIGGVCMT